MAQRIVRAERKIRNAGIPYRVPPAGLLPERTAGVLAVLYLMFNEGYSATAGADMVRADLCAEAIRLANDTPYGLSGSIWTRNGARALRVARALEAGVLSINSNSSVRVTTPFGGFKQSGFGRELGLHALDGYSEVKNVYYSTEG